VYVTKPCPEVNASGSGVFIMLMSGGIRGDPPPITGKVVGVVGVDGVDGVVGVDGVDGVAQIPFVMILLCSVTAPFRANNCPCTVAPVFAVMDVNAKMCPTK
jgi:hypothetical protein